MLPDIVRHAILMLATLVTAFFVYRTFVRALRTNDSENYELGSGRLFDAFTTDNGTWLFIVCIILALLSQEFGIKLSAAVRDSAAMLFVGFCSLLIWTDLKLARHFNRYQADQPTLMTSGPYKLIRHPRYSCWLGLLSSLSLSLSSVLGLIATAGFVLLVVRRVNLEEVFLNDLYGKAYECYRQRTKKIIPFIW